MKKILSLLLATVLMFSLVACGGGGKDDPNLGVYTGTVVDLLGDETPMTEVYPGKNTIELKSGGKATFTLDGDAIDCKWELDGSELVIDIEGTECTGTLKSGTIDLDFMGMMDMTFVKGGSSVPPKPGASTPEKPSTPESSDAGLVGYYKIETLEMDGETMDRSMLEMIGMADSVYLVLDEDGTGRLSFEEEAAITYDDSQIYSPDGEGVPYTLDGDTITVQVENVKMILVRSDEEPPAPVVPGAFPAAFIEEHNGDWHGMMKVYDATGTFEDDIGNQMEVIARFAFNEDGACTPFIAAALTGDSGSNFSNLSVTYNEYGELMLLDGEFIDNPIVDSSNIYAMDGVLMMDIYVDDGEGDSMNVVANLRRLDDTWNYDNEDPALPEAAVEFYMGKSMEEITELFGIDPDELPVPSAGGSSGGSGSASGTPTENPGFSGPTAEFDYAGKGMVMFDYPSDTFTYEKKFGVESLTANDGSLKISFVASWDMEEYAKCMEGYETYVSESGGVIEDGLSYAGFEATRCTWENVIGDVNVETYILFDEAHGDYVGVNVIATASSQSAMDANRDVLEAILHSVH